MRIESKSLPVNYDYLAPDGSEIRLFPSMNGGGLCHCTLPPGGVSKAVRHQTVEEIWYFLSGKGEVWRRHDDQEQIDNVEASVSLTIPKGSHFQFRNTGSEPLCFVIVTMPPWPGESEALAVPGRW